MAGIDNILTAPGNTPSNFSQLVDMARYMPDDELERYVKALRRHLALIQAVAADNDPNLVFTWQGSPEEIEKLISEIEHEHL